MDEMGISILILFCQKHSDYTKKFFETDIICLLCLVGIPMGANCVRLLVDLFFYSHEAYFIQGLLNKDEKKQARCNKFTFRFIDDVLTLNSCKFDDFVDRIYPIELEIKDTIDTSRSDSHLDLHPEIASQVRLKTNLYDKTLISIFPL